MKLTIEGDSLLGRDLAVYLDDTRIDMLRSLHLDIGVNDVNVVSLASKVDSVSVSAAVLAELQALVDKQDDPS